MPWYITTYFVAVGLLFTVAIIASEQHKLWEKLTYAVSIAMCIRLGMGFWHVWPDSVPLWSRLAALTVCLLWDRYADGKSDLDQREEAGCPSLRDRITAAISVGLSWSLNLVAALGAIGRPVLLP